MPEDEEFEGFDDEEPPALVETEAEAEAEAVQPEPKPKENKTTSKPNPKKADKAQRKKENMENGGAKDNELETNVFGALDFVDEDQDTRATVREAMSALQLRHFLDRALGRREDIRAFHPECRLYPR